MAFQVDLPLWLGVSSGAPSSRLISAGRWASVGRFALGWVTYGRFPVLIRRHDFRIALDPGGIWLRTVDAFRAPAA